MDIQFKISEKSTGSFFIEKEGAGEGNNKRKGYGIERRVESTRRQNKGN